MKAIEYIGYKKGSRTIKILLGNKFGAIFNHKKIHSYWYNSPQESFFSHLKDEIDYKSCNSFNELHSMVDNYIDYYNNRYQWNLNKLTPVKYRNQLISQNPFLYVSLTKDPF